MKAIGLLLKTVRSITFRFPRSGSRHDFRTERAPKLLTSFATTLIDRVILISISNPHSLGRDKAGEEIPAGRGKRENLSIKLSRDDGKTWPINKTLEPGPSAYSDLAVLPDGIVLCPDSIVGWASCLPSKSPKKRKQDAYATVENSQAGSLRHFINPKIHSGPCSNKGLIRA